MRKIHCHGYNADVDIAAAEDLWSQGGTYAFPAAAAATTVVSDSANDTSAGTGARTVRVHGLDANLQEIKEDATMNGTTPVALTSQFYRVNLVEVLTAGSGLANAGIIGVKHSSTFINAIPAGANRSRAAIFTCSAEHKRWRLPRAYATVLLDTVKTAVATIYTRKNGGLWQLRTVFTAMSTGNSSHGFDLASPLDLDAGEDVKLTVSVTADNTAIAGGFDIWAGGQD